MNKIVVIIVSFNGEKWIRQCLNSVFQSSILPKVIVVDNKSTDNTVSIIKKEFKEVLLIKCESNLGFGKANNLGFKKALELDAEYFMLVNQDVYLKPNTIKVLLGGFNHGYGLISPMHMDGKGSQLDLYFQSCLSPVSCPNLLSDMMLNKQLKPIYSVDFVNAAVWMINKQTLEKVGGFNPYFFHYAEDDDYINRCKFKEIKVGVMPKVFIYHDRIQKYRGVRTSHFENVEDVKLMNPNRTFTYKKMYKFTFKKILKSFINFNKSDFNKSYNYLNKLRKNKTFIIKTKKEILENNYPFLR